MNNKKNIILSSSFSYAPDNNTCVQCTHMYVCVRQVYVSEWLPMSVVVQYVYMYRAGARAWHPSTAMRKNSHKEVIFQRKGSW